MPETISTLRIELALAKHFNYRTNLIIPNISWGLRGMHECDMFIVRPSGYCIEVEIKRSRSDFLADFKKKHQHVDKRIAEMYYCSPEELYDKCKDEVPLHCGILTVSTILNKTFVQTKRSPVRQKCRKLTDKEKLKVATLGCMRIWGLKQVLISK